MLIALLGIFRGRHPAAPERGQVAKDFAEEAVSDRLEKLSAILSALKSYQEGSSNPESRSRLASAYSDDSRAFEEQRSAYREVTDKYDDLRLIGSATAIEAAYELNEAARGLYNYNVAYRARLSGEPLSVAIAAAEQFRDEQGASTSASFWNEYTEYWDIIEAEVRGLEREPTTTSGSLKS